MLRIGLSTAEEDELEVLLATAAIFKRGDTEHARIRAGVSCAIWLFSLFLCNTVNLEGMDSSVREHEIYFRSFGEKLWFLVGCSVDLWAKIKDTLWAVYYTLLSLYIIRFRHAGYTDWEQCFREKYRFQLSMLRTNSSNSNQPRFYCQFHLISFIIKKFNNVQGGQCGLCEFWNT